MLNKILVTGGLGYIGSHTVLKLLELNYSVVIIDNLSNSNVNTFKILKFISKKDDKLKLYIGDVNNNLILEKIFNENKIDGVIHFAAFKSVSESITKPLDYYHNNVGGTINLLKYMEKNGVKNIIFSSSSTIYGEPNNFPVTELTELKTPKTPYGKTKLICENILSDNSYFNVISLRYFNPVGNHKTGLIYENPNGVPENLFPYIVGVINKKYEHLRIFGDTYNTTDGTSIRDYIDVNDLSRIHINCLTKKLKKKSCIINCGYGHGYSVLQIVKIFEKISGKILKKKYLPPRKGDVSEVISVLSKKKEIKKILSNNFYINESVKNSLLWEKKYQKDK
jgi:UDP-glucose 4-epimerase